MRSLSIPAGALTVCLLGVAGAQPSTTQSAAAAERFASVAQRAVQHQLDYSPVISYFTGLPAPDHRRWTDRSPQAIAAYERKSDALLAELRAIDPAGLGKERINYDILREQLEAEAQQRVCRSELWDVSHMGGWHLGLVRVAQEQPVGIESERAQALERWSAVPRVVDQEIANLERGVQAGYTSPKSVVERVIQQVDGLAAGAKSPFLSPAERSEDAAFKAAFAKVIDEQVNPALRRYAGHLRTHYLPKAREALGIVAHPNGKECYQASLRGYTTLTRTAQEVHDLGLATVTRNAAIVADLGEKKFGTRDLAAIVRKVKEAPDNKFASEEELVRFSRAVVERSRERSVPAFLVMPAQPVLVEPFLEFMRGSGASSHYEIQVDASKPAYYRIQSENWAMESRGGAEITAVHEAYPGHHMQIALSRTVEQSPVAKLSFNSAYIEGWARYSEMLAEELGMYATDYALISRRVWPARGMVADPGLHVLGWTKEQTTKYLADTGRFTEKEALDVVDRMSVLPGQLTAYDSGGLEIMGLREQAKKALGDRFDLREFHQVVLGDGVVTLGTLRRNVEEWVSQRGRQ